MKKLLIAIFVLLALTSFAYADQTCYVSQDCPFTSIVHNTTQYYFNGTVENSLYDTEQSYYLNQEMTQGVINGTKIFYNYNYTFNNSGYYTRETVANGHKETEQITVMDIDNTSLAGLIMGNWIWIIMILLVLVVGIVMFFINNSKK